MYKPVYDSRSNVLIFVDDFVEKRDYLDGEINVFVCGALQDPDKMASLIERPAPFTPAVAAGFEHIDEEIDNAPVAFMIPSENPHTILTGILWLDLTPDELDRIETIELRGNLRQRSNIMVRVGGKTVDAITYMRCCD